jgi:hypothetical protein
MVAAGAHTAAKTFSELQPDGCFRDCQLLHIGVHCDKLDATDLFTHHACNGVTTGSA